MREKYNQLLKDEAFLVQIVEILDENGSIGEEFHVTYDKGLIQKERMIVKNFIQDQS
jgi:hypothetical protein